MNCAEGDDAMVQRTLGTLEEERRPALEAHLAGCERCRREAGRVERLADDLGRVLRQARDAASARLASEPPPRSRGRLLSAAAVLLFAATLAYIVFRPARPWKDQLPADATPPREQAPLERLVLRWLAGEDVEKEILDYGRKAVPALRRHASNPRARALAERIEARKLRVLYVEHPPRYEYRFLKNALLRDPQILAHCFLTSGDGSFPQEHTKSDEDPLFREPLREFPRELKTLLSFDVVIYGDVDPAVLGPEGARNLEKFVTDFGGGLIFISGYERNPRTLANTPLERLLPVVADPRRREESSDPQGYRLTEAGKKSPLTQFAEFGGDPARNLEHWEDRDGKGDGLTEVRWRQEVARTQPGAQVLVTCGGYPLFVTLEAGRGRVFWSGTDETWLWRYLVGDSPWFYPFWQGVIDWASRR